MKALHCLAFLTLASAPLAFALEPPPGGGYPGQITALGDDALFSDTSSGTINTAIGYEALYSNTDGYENIAVGVQALFGNTTGYANLAIGDYSFESNTTGIYNIAIGEETLQNSISGDGNIAIGWSALARSTAGQSGAANTAIGFSAMAFSTSGAFNAAVGNTVMAFNATGSFNVAMGHGAMNMSSGSYNVALGQSSGLNMAGNYNIAVGSSAGLNLTTGSNNIEIGNQGVKKDKDVIRIGTVGTQKQTFLAGISGSTISGGAAVMVSSSGQLGVATSSARFKDNIQPMDKASEAILSLKPVTFRYKKELDLSGIPQFGLVAEDVAKIDPGLVIRDEAGKPFTVRYEAVNAMLLNEFLKEHRVAQTERAKVAALEAQGAQLQKTVADLQAALKAQAAQIEQVSAQVQGGAVAPQLVSATN